jgi:U4/U6 small nuclear ribonucleoprotein PRP31
LHKKLQDIYERHFPELEQMVSDPILYSRCILLIRNGLNPNQVALDFLPHGLEMQIKMALSITKGEPLSETELRELEKVARLVAQLQEEHELILKYLESAMSAVAPNLSAVVGSKVAARLVVTAGGVKALSQIPACNIQVMGGPRKSAGNSHWSSGAEIQSKHLGIFGEMDIVKFSSTKDKKKMVRILASKYKFIFKANQWVALRTQPVWTPQGPGLRGTMGGTCCGKCKRGLRKSTRQRK